MVAIRENLNILKKMTNNKTISYNIEIKLGTSADKYCSENSFEKYISSLPKYYKRHRSKYESHIKDFLIKNRSARLADIVRGCQDQGLELKAYDSSPIFYKSLKHMIEDGKVSKKDKVYFWNYNE